MNLPHVALDHRHSAGTVRMETEGTILTRALLLQQRVSHLGQVSCLILSEVQVHASPGAQQRKNEMLVLSYNKTVDFIKSLYILYLHFT